MKISMGLYGESAHQIALTLIQGFNKHYRLFREASRAAKVRFERRDWAGQHRAVKERIQFYDDRVDETVERLLNEFNADSLDDTTWQQALAELLKVSDVVLMDLRNFVAANLGCLYELQTLAATAGRLRVVVLVNERTERAAAQAATAQAPAGRFVWLAQQGSTPPATDAVLAPLLAADAT